MRHRPLTVKIYKSISSLTHKIIPKIPVVGIIGFMILFVYSSTLYPGGSHADLNSEGFDWLHNYWCNLTSEKGMNGQQNPARPFAIFAMITLCSSLIVFFIQFANVYIKHWYWKQIVKFSGGLSMLFAMLIFTKYHDLMTIISSFFGLFAVIGIIKAIYQSELLSYKTSGVICLIFLGLNNFIYYTSHFMEWLPLLQKITFLMVLTWITGLSSKLEVT